MQRQDVDRVLLVGGSTRIPAVRDILQDYFGDRVELNHQVCYFLKTLQVFALSCNTLMHLVMLWVT